MKKESGSQPSQHLPAEQMDPLGTTPWRVGRKVGRTVYDVKDRLIGVMDTPDIASLVVDGVNGYWGRGVEPEVLPAPVPGEGGGAPVEGQGPSDSSEVSHLRARLKRMAKTASLYQTERDTALRDLREARAEAVILARGVPRPPGPTAPSPTQEPECPTCDGWGRVDHMDPKSDLCPDCAGKPLRPPAGPVRCICVHAPEQHDANGCGVYYLMGGRCQCKHDGSRPAAPHIELVPVKLPAAEPPKPGPRDPA
jgi:hypothetical protein